MILQAEMVRNAFLAPAKRKISSCTPRETAFLVFKNRLTYSALRVLRELSRFMWKLNSPVRNFDALHFQESAEIALATASIVYKTSLLTIVATRVFLWKQCCSCASSRT